MTAQEMRAVSSCRVIKGSFSVEVLFI